MMPDTLPSYDARYIPLYDARYIGTARTART
jgi:hypothetical protein